MFAALTTDQILSFIFVPALIVIFVVALIFMFAKRTTPDAVVSLMYELKLTRHALSERRDRSPKELKKIAMHISKLQLLADKAAFEDMYDVSVAQSAFDKAGELATSLNIAAPKENDEYVLKILNDLEPAIDYLESVTGISIESAVSFNYKIFSQKAKKERAAKYLDQLKK